jgi:16S rRNA (guanine1516-N2)-methyltransferase
MPTRPESPEVTLVTTGRGTDLDNAARFGIRVVDRRDPMAWQLWRVLGRLQLGSPDGRNAVTIDLDVSQGPLARRLRSMRRDEPLGRACGLHKRATPPTVVDATAGLCRDAMALATMGCRVTAIERIPAFAFLVNDSTSSSWLGERLHLVFGEALPALGGLAGSQAPDVVYLDPMFDASGGAQVKKDMQVCRALAAPPDDAPTLLQSARAIARERVVVKRAADGPPLADGVSFTVSGERVRFDVYVAAGAPR